MALSAADIISIVQKRGRGNPPAAIADVFVNPLVKTLNFLNAKIELARVEQTVDTILLTLADTAALAALATGLDDTSDTVAARLRFALEDIASNFGLTRKAASVSRGSVLLIRYSGVTEQIQVPAGRKVVASSSNQEYAVSQTIIIQPASMIYDSTLNGYVASVPVESTNAGLNTIAPIGMIDTLRDAIIGIDAVYNTDAVVGGRDIESDTSLGNRIKTVLSANNIGTSAGYKELVMALQNVKDSSVVGAGDPLMTRDLGDGGSVDIYVTDAIPTQITEAVTTSGTVFTPTRQPLVNDVNTIQTTGFTPTTITITPDSSQYAGSTRSQSTITFDVAFAPGNTITYQVNDLVSQVQAYLNDTNRKILGADVMVKEALTIEVDIIFGLATLPGFSPSVVKTNVEAAITQNVSMLGIAHGLELSDIIRIATNVDGVDRVNLPPIKFNRTSLSSPTWVNVIEAAANEVLRPGQVQAVL